MYELGVKVRNYKCFKSESGFEELKRVNLIIGRNNSGKSALLDVIEIISKGEYGYDQTTWRGKKEPEIIFNTEIEESVTSRVFSDSTSGGEIGGNHGAYGRQYIGRNLTWLKSGKSETKILTCDDTNINPPIAKSGVYSTHLSDAMPIPIEGKIFRRVSAERDIAPEISKDGKIEISPNGVGVTNAIQCFINKSSLSSAIVETEILDALNEIFSQDAIFTDIVCQLHENSYWEIFLEEEHKGRIALSKSGSGIKTVITVLASLFLIPKLENKPLRDYIFGFEELENNIHPALLRRLNNYIYRSAERNDFIYFLTTHSNVLIDQFSKQKDAQIVHVTQYDGVSSCYTAKTYIENNGILDDLDVRASDILQANGIIWVEGPSDRIYLNRWIQLWSDNKLKEGTHYQIIFYGGRLLSHLALKEVDILENGISMLNANRNAIILIDSDKKTKSTRINETKRRIKTEFSERKSLCWITKGKEIENYIPSDVVNSFWNVKESKQVPEYESFFDHLDKVSTNEGKKYSAKKPLLAENIISRMTKENMKNIMDMDERMRKVCSEIKKWNS